MIFARDRRVALNSDAQKPPVIRTHKLANFTQTRRPTWQKKVVLHMPKFLPNSKGEFQIMRPNKSAINQLSSLHTKWDEVVAIQNAGPPRAMVQTAPWVRS